MKLNNTIKATGELSIVVTGSNGEIKQNLHVPNLVVTVGKQYIASRMASATASVMSHMAIGSGTVIPVDGDTTLGSELGRVGTPLFIFEAASNVVTATATFGEGVGTGAVTEAGIFNNVTNGTMLCRTVFPIVNKGEDDTIAITWTITIS